MKGLSIDVRQRVFDYFRNELNSITMKYYLERDDGYPSYRSIGMTDDQIQQMCDLYIPRFEHVNQIMAEYGRPPLFSDPRDSFQSAKEFTVLWELRNDEELAELFGCTYAEYEPRPLDVPSE